MKAARSVRHTSNMLIVTFTLLHEGVAVATTGRRNGRRPSLDSNTRVPNGWNSSVRPPRPHQSADDGGADAAHTRRGPEGLITKRRRRPVSPPSPGTKPLEGSRTIHANQTEMPVPRHLPVSKRRSEATGNRGLAGGKHQPLLRPLFALTVAARVRESSGLAACVCLFQKQESFVQRS